MKDFICTIGGECFGHERSVKCSVLTSEPSTYAKGICPFQKPERDVTDGVRYPHMLDKSALEGNENEDDEE